MQKTDESLHEFVLRNLEETKGTWPRVAEDSGVPKRTLEKIARKEIVDPGVSHIEKLANYFRRRSPHQGKAAA